MNDCLDLLRPDQRLERPLIVEGHEPEVRIAAVETGNVGGDDLMPVCRQFGSQCHTDQAGSTGDKNIHYTAPFMASKGDHAAVDADVGASNEGRAA